MASLPALPRLTAISALLLLATGTATADDAADAWRRLTTASPSAGSSAETLTFNVDLTPDASPGYSVDTVAGQRVARYRMAFNNVAEGWSWQPEVAVAGGDYYRYKFLPLGTAVEERGERTGWGPLDGEFKAPVRWRHDYFAAFENGDDFYPRGDDADTGFSLALPADAALPLRMEIRLRLAKPATSESTTYWRAIPGRPVELTLKNHYFLGRLDAVSFFDATGRLLARHEAGTTAAAQNSARNRQ